MSNAGALLYSVCQGLKWHAVAVSENAAATFVCDNLDQTRKKNGTGKFRSRSRAHFVRRMRRSHLRATSARIANPENP